MCGQQTPERETLMDHTYLKSELGFSEVTIISSYYPNGYHYNLRKLNFCPSCSRKSYTIEELKTIGNYNQWSY